jgi:mannose-1-phosphate guanylyltransferase
LILGGGKGRRLEGIARRFSGRPLPKQFCRFGGARSLLQETVRRLAPLLPPDDAVVVVDVTQLGQAETQLGGLEGLEILPQPRDRGTAPGVLLPLSRMLERDGDCIVLVTPSDHAFADDEAFRDSILLVQAAIEEGLAEMVVFGADATAPNSDYGWIVRGPHRAGPLYAVNEFVEKPDPPRARHMFADGGMWNTMFVVARATALYDVYRRALPVWAAVFDTARELPEGQREQFLRASYEHVPPADFSRDILGVAPDLAVYPCPDRLGWTDLGTPERMLAWLERNGRVDSTVPVRDRLDRLASGAEGSKERLWSST